MEKSLKLRAPEPSDLDALYLWENDPEISRYGSAVAPYSRALLWAYINSYDADPFHAEQLRLMIDVDGETCGAIDLYNVDGKNLRAFVGIVVDKSKRGQGIGKSALEALSDYCCASLGLHQLVAVVPEPNVRSIELFESAGFENVAQLAQWVRLGKEFVNARLLCKIL